jgi:CheY-like chemotaxis protein
VFPRVLTVHGAGPDRAVQGIEGAQAIDGVQGTERVVAPDGAAAIAQAAAESFDAVCVDLSLPPLDGWLVLATLGGWSRRPRLIAVVDGPAEARRARALGADLCVLAGTDGPARALHGAWPRHLVTSSPAPTTNGARA